MDDDQNSPSRLVSLIALCGFGILVALAFPFWSPAASSWLETLGAWGGLYPQSPSSHSSEPAPTPSSWAEAEIRAELMQCVQSIGPINAELTPAASMREGECGTPAPVLLSSLTYGEKVTFDPPLLINCPLVVALHRWLNEAVQPAAKEAFGSPITKIIGSSYACRNVYNEPNGRLSQHAFANAIDLPIFVLADGRKVDVAHGWGPTDRDLAQARKTSAAKKEASGKTLSRKMTPTDLVKVSAGHAAEAGVPAAPADVPDEANSAEAKFLRLVQQGACKIFSTVLGPEFNDVHRTHLHFDLQDRGAVKVCK